jgi:hypothetical protein
VVHVLVEDRVVVKRLPLAGRERGCVQSARAPRTNTRCPLLPRRRLHSRELAVVHVLVEDRVVVKRLLFGVI